MLSDYRFLLVLILGVFTQNSFGSRSESPNPGHSFDGDDNSVGLPSCKTVSNGPGVCVHIYECPNYKDLIASKVRPIVCHWSGRVPVICCPVIDPPIEPNHEPESPVEVIRRERNQSDCGTRKSMNNEARDVSRVLGGSMAYKGEFPWNVAIYTRQIDGENVHECGGSIISERYILTAAHCFTTSRSSNYLIGVGSNDLETTIKYAIDEIILHPDYENGAFYNDIALVRLSEQLTFNETIRPICLPFDYLLSQTDSSSSPYSEPVTVSGWGNTEHNGQPSRLLLKADLFLTSRDVCDKAYSRLGSNKISLGITDDFICAGTVDGKKDACQSDSGGPLIAKLETNDQIEQGWESKFVQVGIVSFGYKCGVRGYPGVYVNVHKYLSWIVEIIKEPSVSIYTLMGNND